MEEDSKKVLKIIVALVCLAAAGFLGYRTIANKTGSDLDEFKGQMALLMCTDKNCGHVFEGNLKEFFEYTSTHVNPATYTAAGLCPKCGKETVQRALKCEKCGNVNLHDGPSACPKCGFDWMAQKNTNGTGK